MSRTRKAFLGAAFSYAQSGLALVAGLGLLPFILRRADTGQYGAWLGFLEFVGYAALLDLGLLSTLPWLVAKLDGRNDRAAMRRMTGDAVAIAAATGAAYFAASLALCLAAPHLVAKAQGHWLSARGPILLVVALTAVCFPFRTFNMVLVGLQDVVFLGLSGLAQTLAGIVLTVWLLCTGWGLYSLAVALAMPPLLGSFAAFARAAWLAPDLVRGWSRPRLARVAALSREGAGAWMSQTGWRMAAASTSMVLLMVGPPTWAVVYACTAKSGLVLMPLVWQLTDSGLVGVAQLHGEGNARRVREVVLTMLRLGLTTAGAVAFGILVVNPRFVILWVGRDKFGGMMLNAAVAGCLIAYSLGHAILTTTSAVGKRTEVGFISLLQGAVDLASALVLGHWFGLIGVAASGIVSSILVALPLGGAALAKAVGLRQAELWTQVVFPWSLRAIPLLSGAFGVGVFVARAPTAWLALVIPVMASLYLLTMRQFYADVPLPGYVGAVVRLLRLVPNS